ncbi:hypothetical protein NIAHE148_28740 [Escherichia coli]|nr:hypothetical protein NIAHE148_28740 [Escherichia coli]BCT64214.1 hypothetical protein NIAHE189_28750 [Escherichia coli]BCU42384.1 hypothetical protein R9P_09400 [Escherichia coli]BEB57946.1 hypothetical protein VEE39_20890 [Escherichia coli]
MNEKLSYAYNLFLCIRNKNKNKNKKRDVFVKNIDTLTYVKLNDKFIITYNKR